MSRLSILLSAAACLLGGCQHSSPLPTSVPADPAQAPTSAPVAASQGTAAARRPAVVMHELNPWGAVIGAEIPSFVLYDDGFVIYQQEQDRGARVLQAQLSAEERQRRTRAVFDALQGAPRNVELSHWTDQPTVRVMARVQDQWRVIYIYGLGTDGKPTTELAHGTVPLSPAIAQAYLDLRGFTTPDGQRWHPESLEVMLGGFEYAKDVLPWPSDIPAPPADFVPDRNHRVRRFEVPSSHGKALGRLMASLGDRRAVSVNGHSWSVSTRPVIPGQREIQAAARF